MTTIQLRDSLHKSIDSADNRLLKMLNALVESYADNEDISEDQKRVLDKRIEKIERGEATFYSYEEVRDRLGKYL